MRLDGMDATLDFDLPAFGEQPRRFHLLVGANGWVADDWFADVQSAVAQARVIEAAQSEPGAGWRVIDEQARVVASSEREDADTNAKVALLFLLPVLVALGALAAYVALAGPAGLWPA